MSPYQHQRQHELHNDAPPPPLISIVQQPREASHCLYAGGNCPDPRVRKDNGTFLRLCNVHRKIAVAYQRKFVKKRMQVVCVTHDSSASDSGNSSTDTSPSPSPSPEAVSKDDEYRCKSPGCVDPRVPKSTRQLHRFCMHHREMAKAYQQKYYKKQQEASQRLARSSRDTISPTAFWMLSRDVLQDDLGPAPFGTPVRTSQENLAVGGATNTNDTCFCEVFNTLESDVFVDVAKAMLEVAHPSWFAAFVADTFDNLHLRDA